MFVCPAIFFAGGILAHTFIERRLWYLVVLIGAIVIIYDMFLAYRIMGSYFKIQMLSGLVEGTWNLERAARDVGFWLLILSGAVVSILWSVLFIITNHQFANLNAEKCAINSHEDEIKSLKESLGVIKVEERDIKSTINRNNAKIEACDRFTRMKSIEWESLERELDQFHLGWTDYISEVCSSQRQADEEVEQAEKVFEEVKNDLHEKVERINQEVNEVLEYEVFEEE